METDYRLTVRELYNILRNNRYVIVTTYYGYQHAVNCRIKSILSKIYEIDDKSTDYVSWRECSFTEYISNKNGFV